MSATEVTGQHDTIDDQRSREQAKRRGSKSRAPRRRLVERVTLRDVVGIVLALLTFVVIVAVLSDRRQMATAVVPVERIPAGGAITPDLVEVVEFPASTPFAGELVTEAQLTDGLVAGRMLEPGEPVVRSALGAAAERTPGRVMSVPVESWGAVGGELVVGDQIDVIDTAGDAAVYVLNQATVVDRAAEDGGGGVLGGSSERGLWVAIEVDPDQALRLAQVIELGKFVIVRSTGAEVPEGSG